MLHKKIVKFKKFKFQKEIKMKWKIRISMSMGNYSGFFFEGTNSFANQKSTWWKLIEGNLNFTRVKILCFVDAGESWKKLWFGNLSRKSFHFFSSLAPIAWFVNRDLWHCKKIESIFILETSIGAIKFLWPLIWDEKFFVWKSLMMRNVWKVKIYLFWGNGREIGFVGQIGNFAFFDGELL